MSTAVQRWRPLTFSEMRDVFMLVDYTVFGIVSAATYKDLQSRASRAKAAPATATRRASYVVVKDKDADEAA